MPEIVYLEANLHGQPSFARMEAYRGAKSAQDLGLRPDIAGGLSQIVPEIVYLRANVRNPWQLAIEVAVHVCRCAHRGLPPKPSSSPRLFPAALRHLSMDSHIFIERDPDRCRELNELKTEFPELAADIRVQQGDSNAETQKICAEDWRSSRAVLFLDPYGMQVEWKTIEAVARRRAKTSSCEAAAGGTTERLTSEALPRHRPHDGLARRRAATYGASGKIGSGAGLVETASALSLKGGSETALVDALREPGAAGTSIRFEPIERRSGDTSNVKVLPLRMTAAEVEALDDSWRRLGVKSRTAMI